MLSVKKNVLSQAMTAITVAYKIVWPAVLSCLSAPLLFSRVHILRTHVHYYVSLPVCVSVYLLVRLYNLAKSCLF